MVDTRLPQETPTGPWEKSYSYLRSALVALLLALGAAVIHETAVEKWDPLGSVSAYYYTPAQAMFVGSLIGVAACMVALTGRNPLEEAFLNLGGMCAAVVAVVPTARKADLDEGVERELVAATKANVENSVVTLLVVGLLCLVVSALLARRGRRGRSFWLGYGAAWLLFAAGTAVFVVVRDWFIHHAHYAAAGGLLLCVIGIACVNARLKEATTQTRKRYSSLAVLMVVVAIEGSLIVYATRTDVFWLEIAVAALFLAFWAAQTYDHLPKSTTADIAGTASRDRPDSR